MHPIAQRLAELPVFREMEARRALIAVSGGSDSVALLRLCHAVWTRPDRDIVVAHFDHALRSDSADDARWVAELCARLGIPCRQQRSNGFEKGSEEELRRERYAFLESVALAESCGAILTGHSAEDQAETILHHLLRGTGLAGLAGIPESRALSSGVHVIRPLLSFRRAELRDYLRETNQEYREDPTNAAGDYTRNRLRNEVFPFLAALGFETAVGQIGRLAGQFREAQQALEWMADVSLDVELLPPGDAEEEGVEVVRLSTEGFAAMPRHLAREMCVALWKRMDWPRKHMGYDDWNRLVEFAVAGKTLHLPGGIEADSRDGVLRLRKLRGH